jgi:undecaprenyl-diphosphatase
MATPYAVGMLAAIDEAVAQWFADHRIGVLDDIAIWLANASELLGVLAAVGVVWVCVAVWFGGWRPMLQVVLVLAAVSVLTGWMKPVIDRPRPPADVALTQVGGSAMPSSQALITSAIVVAVVMADWWASARLRRAVLVVGVVGCLFVGVAMVYMGAHWLTDVLVGWALGVGLTWPLMRVALAMSPAVRSGRTSAPPRRPPPE